MHSLEPTRPVAASRVWGELSAPVNPHETVIRSRAQSYLTGPLIGGVCPPLPLPHALDVLRWAGLIR